jgi:GNAT superfamily N-acetyltransferase
MEIDLTGTSLRRAARQEWRELGEITGDAFVADPVVNWMCGTPAGIQSMFTTLARAIYLRHGHCYFAGDDGAAMWLPPGAEAAPGNQGSLAYALGLLRFVAGQLRHGTSGAIRRGMALADLMEQWHPKEPHLYLFSIATRQRARGKGLGKALLAPMLAHCDREGIPVYLENSNPDNSGFYGTHGFERLGLFHVAEDGPVMEPMWREAGAAP